MTKAVVISPLKLLHGHPLGTATALVGRGGRHYSPPFYMLPPGALHVGTHAGSSVACLRFEGAT